MKLQTPVLAYFFQSLLMSLFLIGSFGLNNASAQIIFPISPVLPDGDIGQPLVVNFTITDAPAGTVRWFYTRVSGPPLNTLGINFTNPAASGGVINQNIANTATVGVPYKINVRAQVTEGDGTVHNYDKVYTLVVWTMLPSPCEDLTEIALVLDASGSMNSTTSASATRWSDLKDVVKSYLPSLNDRVRSATDRLQVIFFQGSSTHTLYNGTFNGVDWTDEADIALRVFGETTPGVVNPGGATPMGRGITQAISGFTAAPADARQLIILFSDGYQNVDPRFVPGVNRICNTAINNVGLRVCTDAGTPLGMGGNGVQIYTIGVGGADETLLRDLANPDDAFAFAYDTDDLDLFFATTIPSGFRGCSPRMVDYRKGTLADKGDFRSEKFQIDSLIDDLSIRIKVKTPNAFVDDNIQLYKDGVLTNFQPAFSGQVVSYYIDFTSRPGLEFGDGGGEWEVRFSGTENAGYEIMAMVEDRYLKTDVTVENTPYFYAGDNINVLANITVANQPVDSAEVIAYLLRPGEDLGDLAARTNLADTPKPLEDTLIAGLSESSLIARAKIDELLSDPAFLAQLQNENRVIPLTDGGNGRYEGSFVGAENVVTGTYKLAVKYRGRIEGFGEYESLDTKWVYFDFSRPEDIDLNDFVTPIPLSKNVPGNYSIRITPTNRFGKKMGPAQAHRIRVLVDQQNLVLEDNLDGSYSAVFTAQANALPTVEVYVIDQNRPVKEWILPPLKKLGISVHAGVLQALKNAAPLSASDQGTYYEIDLAYRLSNHFSLQLVGGNYQFDNLAFKGGNLFLDYAFANTSFSGFKPRISAGAGLFKPDNADLKFVYGGRVGLAYKIYPGFEFGLDAGVYHLPAPDYLLGYAGLGIRLYL